MGVSPPTGRQHSSVRAGESQRARPVCVRHVDSGGLPGDGVERKQKRGPPDDGIERKREHGLLDDGIGSQNTGRANGSYVEDGKKKMYLDKNGKEKKRTSAAGSKMNMANKCRYY